MHANYSQKVGREISSPNSQVLRNNDGFFPSVLRNPQLIKPEHRKKAFWDYEYLIQGRTVWEG